MSVISHMNNYYCQVERSRDLIFIGYIYIDLSTPLEVTSHYD